MAQILVRDLDKKVVDSLKKRAQEDGRSLQSEVKAILEEAARARTVHMDEARALVERVARKLRGRPFPDSVSLIREDRDA